MAQTPSDSTQGRTRISRGNLESDSVETRMQRFSQYKRKTTTFDYDDRGHRKPLALENTYRMAPKPEEAFRSHIAREVMETALKLYLKDKNYNKEQIKGITISLADLIKDRMKAQGFSTRYKYVCLVTIGEKKDQGFAECSRCLWDTKTDNFASVTYATPSFFAVATLYALYWE